jgi:hypothetical protein
MNLAFLLLFNPSTLRFYKKETLYSWLPIQFINRSKGSVCKKHTNYLRAVIYSYILQSIVQNRVDIWPMRDFCAHDNAVIPSLFTISFLQLNISWVYVNTMYNNKASHRHTRREVQFALTVWALKSVVWLYDIFIVELDSNATWKQQEIKIDQPCKSNQASNKALFKK